MNNPTVFLITIVLLIILFSFALPQYPQKNVNDMNGYEFEDYCAKLLEKNGYHKVKITSRSADQGIDIIAWKRNKRYAIQCKRYKGNVSNKAVQEAYSGMRFYDCDIAVVMTNSKFTKSAKELADKLGVKLFDGSVLKDMDK